LTAFLTFMGFNMTPNGGKLPEEIKSLPAGVDAPSPIADAQADSRAAARDAAIQTIKGQ
jgi:hypothetical protein